MARTSQYQVFLPLAVALLALPGCAPHMAQVMPPLHLAHATPPRLSQKPFSLDTPVERIAADQRGKAILNRDVPGLMSNKYYLLFEDMSLSQLASLSSGQLTQSRLHLVEADLSQLPR